MNAKSMFLVGSVGLIIGSILPWASIHLNLTGQTQSISGINGDGVFTLGLGVILMIIGLTKKPVPSKNFSTIGGIAGVLAGAFMIWKLFALQGATISNIAGQISVGYGIYICVIASILVIIGGLQKAPAAPVQQVPAKIPE